MVDKTTREHHDQDTADFEQPTYRLAKSELETLLRNVIREELSDDVLDRWD